MRFAKRMSEAADPNLNREFGKALKTAAQPVADIARAMAPNLSGSPEQIAPTIKVAGGATKVVIKAGKAGNVNPPARSFEGPKKFRHPVFGNRNVWVSQSPKPYLAPALAASAKNIRRASEVAVIEVLRQAGF